MSFVSLAGLYFILWWVVLFVVLPFGVRTETDEANITPGTVHSAPIRPMLVRKALITSVLTAIVVAGIWYVRVVLGFDLEAISRWAGAVR